MYNLNNQPEDNHLIQAFLQLDTDHDGFIDNEQFTAFINKQ
jgi:hypothetical protein